MKEGELGASVLSIEAFHLPCFSFSESSSRDEDFEEELLLSTILSSKILQNLREMVIPSKPIDANALEAAFLGSLGLWKKARKVLKENELFKSGKIKLRTLELGETGE